VWSSNGGAHVDRLKIDHSLIQLFCESIGIGVACRKLTRFWLELGRCEGISRDSSNTDASPVICGLKFPSHEPLCGFPVKIQGLTPCCHDLHGFEGFGNELSKQHEEHKIQTHLT
jgi:hypothetical protein